MIIGAGGGSFEIMRYLVERLPIMTTPRWIYTRSQPIAVRNVIEYLAGCLDVPETASDTFDIGGPDVLSYRELFDYYAEEAKLKKPWLIRMPVITPTLSSYWVAMVTPVPLALIKPLIDGLRIRAVCEDERIKDLIPQNLIRIKAAIRAAVNPRQHFTEYTVEKLTNNEIPFEWSRPGDPGYSGGQVFSGSLELVTDSTPEQLWEVLEQISEDLSCCYNDMLWKWWRKLDGYAGKIAFNIGLPGTTFRSGEGVFWKVIEQKPKEKLSIIAEVEIFGWMLQEFVIEKKNDNTAILRLNLKFHPRGLQGIAYWYSTSPLHQFVFYGILHWVADCMGKECRIAFS
jgi:hypothetical protein